MLEYDDDEPRLNQLKPLPHLAVYITVVAANTSNIQVEFGLVRKKIRRVGPKMDTFWWCTFASMYSNFMGRNVRPR